VTGGSEPGEFSRVRIDIGFSRLDRPDDGALLDLSGDFPKLLGPIFRASSLLPQIKCLFAGSMIKV